MAANVTGISEFRRRPPKRLVALVHVDFVFEDEETAIDAACKVVDVDLRADFPEHRRELLMWAMLLYFGGAVFSRDGFKQVGASVRVVEE